MNLKQRELLEKFAETEKERLAKHKKPVEVEMGNMLLSGACHAFVYGLVAFVIIKLCFHFFG